jgi:uncharacterized membrane protein YeaQ/YmgE (transglycosylase-associated protein family)
MTSQTSVDASGPVHDTSVSLASYVFSSCAAIPALRPQVWTVLPGRQDMPIWLTILIGIVAALIGSLIASALGVGDTRGIDWIKLIIQVALAAAGVALVAGRYAPGRRRL